MLSICFIRNWIEAPISSCVKEWLISPLDHCGLGIPSFQNMAEQLQLGKRDALKRSKNENIRDLWSDSTYKNINADSLLLSATLKQSRKSQKHTQTKLAIEHFMRLECQGKIAKTVTELIPKKQIVVWSRSLKVLPGYLYNFVRKAMQQQLPTLANLKRWGRSPSNLCAMCCQIQSNKHVLSNCS